MRKRSKYKVCAQLGYNGRIRRWYGKKRKWEKGKLFRKSDNGSGVAVINPGKSVSNEDRRKGKSRKRGRIRIKDEYRNVLRRRKGRKRRYGGRKIDRYNRYRKEQRKERKRKKKGKDRGRRKGEREGNVKKDESRLSKVEIRADIRRWRSGRVKSVQISRDLISHGKIKRLNKRGEEEGRVKWKGKRRKPGEGREVEKETWKKRKEGGKGRIGVKEYEKQAGKYREVDYVAGRRYVYRRPRSGEVVRPKGRKLTRKV